MKKLVKADLSYDEAKRLLKIRATWGAKISGEQFVERAASVVREGKKGSIPRTRGRRPLDDDDD